MFRRTTYLCRVMKKAFLLLFTFLYLGMSSGFSLEVHYCMGKVTGIQLSVSKKDRCKKCGMAAKKGCCQNQQHFVKISDVHKAVDQKLHISAPVQSVDPFIFHSLVFPIANSVCKKGKSFYIPPSKWPSKRASQFLCVFRL